MSPLKNFICPDAVKIPVCDCLKEGGCRRNNRCATRSYLRLVSRERKWTGKSSTTQCIQGTMCAFLKLTKGYSVSPDQRAFMVNGTNAHTKLEDSPDEYSLLEEKFQDGDITGISDVIETEGGKTILADYKTSGSYKVAKALGIVVYKEPTDEVFKSGKRKGEQKTRKRMKRDPDAVDMWEWILQLNKYRMEYERKYKKKIDELRIQCMVRDGGTYIAHSRGVFLNVYYFNIPMLPDEEVTKYFTTKKIALETALRQGYWNDICSAEENWDGVKCARYCEVAEFCSYGRYLKQEREAEEVSIQGLSEARRLPRLGKIRLGIKKENDKGVVYPKEVDYFILDPSTPNELEREELIKEFHKHYGKQPKQIKVMLPVADVEKIFPQYYKRYGKTTMLQCKGDGNVATCSKEEFAEGLTIKGKDEMGMTLVECKGKDCPYYLSKKCTESAVLQVLLPEIPGAGVWQIVTGSVHSIINLNSGIDYVTAVAGRAHMIPLTLERKKQEIQHDGKKTTHYILGLNMDVKLSDLQKLAMIDPTKAAMELPDPVIDAEDLKVLPNGESVNTKTGEIIDQEPEKKPKPGPKPKEPDKPAAKKKIFKGPRVVMFETAETNGYSDSQIRQVMINQCKKEKTALLTAEEVFALTELFRTTPAAEYFRIGDDENPEEETLRF